MPIKIYPLLYKPGIKRDGTLFQSEYCTNGSWIRFRHGVVKKMGGMKGMNISFNMPSSGLLLTISTTSPNYFGYIGNATRITKFTFNNNFISVAAPYFVISAIGGRPNLIWQFEIIITPDSVRHIVCFGANNAQNITENSAPLLYSGDIEAPTNTQLTTRVINPLANGGICFVSPYLFIYGTNGYVAYSTAANPFDFTTVTGGDRSGTLKISSDKVIYGAAIRGGSNEPSVLFWTMSSVIRITNVGDNEVKFKKDKITKDSSILSSKCVIEDKGVFYWPGTNEFYIYNGLVGTMLNNTHLDFFFQNIDLNQRQKVFGVKNAGYNELCWFFPRKGQQGNSWVLIYNTLEKCWYDTPIRRDAGFFFQETGFLCTSGQALILNDGNYYLWRHEDGTYQVWTPQGLDERTDPIPSSFTTPVISWSILNSSGQMSSEDRWIDVKRIEPDLLMDADDHIMQFVVNTKEYAQSPTTSTVPINLTSITPKADLSVQGRNITFTFSSAENFEIGNIRLGLSIGDGQ